MNRDDTYAVVLRRLQHPTAQTVEEAAGQIADDLMAEQEEARPIFANPPTPLTVSITGRRHTWTYSGATDEPPELDLVEKAALTALIDHVRTLLQPPSRGRLYMPDVIPPQQPLVTWNTNSSDDPTAMGDQ